MSVLVKGMRMPNNCMACDLEEVDDCGNGYRCPLIYKGYTAKIRQDGKLPKCPLVEIPEKHGDLIDRNDLKKEYAMGFDCNNCVSNQKSCQYDAFYAKMDFCLMLDDAPVVIEAEEAKE